MKEYAPWYIICFRIIGFLSLTLISYVIVLLNAYGMIIIIDTITALNIQEIILNLCDQYPTASVVITIIGYIALTIYLLIETVNMLTRMEGKHHGEEK